MSAKREAQLVIQPFATTLEEVLYLRSENAVLRDMLLNPDPEEEKDSVRLHREKMVWYERAVALKVALKDIVTICTVNHDRLGNVQRIESIAARAAAALSKAEHSEPGSPAQSVNARGGNCPPPVFRRGE